MAVVYALVSWGVAQVATTVQPTLLLPDWMPRLVVALLILGFPIALVLAWLFDLSSAGLKREAPAPSDSTSLPAPVTTPQLSSTGESFAHPDHRRSILVLPFSNLSDDAGNEFFSDGITEEILNLLARQSGLRVISRTTSFTFKQTTQDVRSIAAKLGVESVLEGSVRRAGNRVRIVAQLIDAANDAHLWSHSFDRQIEDIFEVQSEIAKNIVDAIHLEPEPCLECTPPTRDMQAYDYYLRGRQYFHGLTKSSLSASRQMFIKAIEIDPGFARAWAGLADAESLTAQWMERTAGHIDAADSASRKALELDPELAEAHSSRGFALSLKGDFESASREFERALELDPQNYNALYLYGRSRFAEGRPDEAARLWAAAHAAQPDEFQSASLRASVLRGLEDPQATEARQQAIDAILRRLELDPVDLRALYLGAGGLMDVGRVAEGITFANRALEIAPTDVSVLYNIACAYARAGYDDTALDLLERRMQAAGTIYREWVEHDTDFDRIRNHPRFIALLEKMPRLSG